MNQWAIIIVGLGALAVFFLFAPAASAGGSSVSSKIVRFAQAIADAEGFNVPGSRPQRNNNPGDFVGSGDAGADSGGYAIYSSLDAGWQRLYHQLGLIVNGQSHEYNLDETISDMAWTWTTTQQDAWSETVASNLGVTRDTPLRGLLT